MPTSDVERVIDQLFVAIQAGDRAAIADLYDEDIQVWHSATDRAVDKADSLAILDWLMAPGVTLRYEVVEQLTLGDRVARRHVLTVAIPDHDDIVMPVAIFLTIADGTIRRIDEYVDAKGTDRLIERIPLPS
jgi:ketosteroid isomerase-like protein